MKLGTRASLLILPVIIFSYGLAAFAVYQQQCQLLVDTEQNRIQFRLGELRSSFTTYNSFADAYLVSLAEGDALTTFIREPNNIYRAKLLSGSLRASLKRYFTEAAEFASLTIVDNNQVIYYTENSTDPFAEATAEEVNFANEMLRNKQLQQWQLSVQNGTTKILQGLILDARTLAPPIPTQLENTIQVVVTIIPSRFNQLLSTAELEYGSQAQILHKLPTSRLPEGELGAGVKLQQDYRLEIIPAPAYLAGLLHSLLKQLLVSTAIGVILTFIALRLLINRFITNPVSRLNQQLHEVSTNRRATLEQPSNRDEIGDLGRRFYQLYEKLHENYRRTNQQYRTDTLTQLPNRVQFYETAPQLLIDARTKQSNTSFIYIDLDNFKFVNDKYGHEVGDQLLKAVASRLNHLVSHALPAADLDSSLVYRLSGDEFIVMLPECNNTLASNIGEKLLHIFVDGYRFELGHFPVTLSLGVATAPEDGHTLSQLVSNADLAMYEAKKSGKNRLACYSKELAKAARKAREIETQLKMVDCDQEFALHYMPVVNRDGSLRGFESLVRWQSPSLGVVSPALFIPIAESISEFEKIDRWVINRAMQERQQLAAIYGENIIVSINISSAELSSDTILQVLTEATLANQTDARNYVLEITETFSLEQDNTVYNRLHQIRALGFKIAIDDFGTGNTSLMQMVDYPIDVIKMDRQMVLRLTDNNKVPLAAALIELCHSQEISVIAEGIETPEQEAFMQRAGCDFQQGYLWGKPKSLTDTIQPLSQWRSESAFNRQAKQ
ncbi:EAL domain-containing protein [Halioxenophilus sp. WMMB6]|uniref:EAL domain-containing protein n=1 Tax=Halioxenophilus sp. WMMB6 TaxID=3073815 RepID=UPI00295E64F5|nr:EAL domain-containing protein [Halioxenophilus sp. WMMB6]